MADKQFVIVGLGRFGASVAETLAEKGYQVIGIDKDQEVVEEMTDHLTQSLQLDATDEKSLNAAGINEADVAVVSIGDDLEASVLVTLILKEMGIKEIIAKAVTDNHGKVLKRVGATRIVFPEREMGIRIASSLVAPEVIEHIGLSDDHSVVELPAPEAFVGKSLKQLNVRANYSVTIIAIRRRIPHMSGEGKLEVKEEVAIVPNPNEVINKDDLLIVIGDNKSIGKLKK